MPQRARAIRRPPPDPDTRPKNKLLACLLPEDFARLRPQLKTVPLLLLMQSTARMALHSVQERGCRWLLMTHDRVGQNEFQLSHEFLAMMHGATRPTVTVVALTLQKAGLIRYKHGHITILDRAGLEAASCECYSTVKTHFDRLGL
jgi:hypothetical protein